MVCLGFAPRAVRWKVQTNPLSYTCTPSLIGVLEKKKVCTQGIGYESELIFCGKIIWQNKVNGAVSISSFEVSFLI